MVLLFLIRCLTDTVSCKLLLLIGIITKIVFDAVVCDLVDIEKTSQSTAESIINNALSCTGVDTGCISQNSTVEVSSFIFRK